MNTNLDITNIICFYTQNGAVDVHAHNCFQIIISVKNSFNSIIDGELHKDLIGGVFNQKVIHSCSAQDSGLLIYFIEANSNIGWHLKKVLAKEQFIDIHKFIPDKILKQAQKDFTHELSKNEMRKIADNLLAVIFQTASLIIPDNTQIDERIKKAILFIDENLSASFSLEDIAKHILLSSERTRHLFVNQIGIPLRQYILWKRIKAVMVSVLNHNYSFYEACIIFGFTDSAHFSKVFKRTFGVSAKTILKNSRNVQFIYPEVQ